SPPAAARPTASIVPSRARWPSSTQPATASHRAACTRQFSTPRASPARSEGDATGAAGRSRRRSRHLRRTRYETNTVTRGTRSHAGQRRRFAEEAGDARQPAVGGECADVDTGYHHRALRAHQVPGEAELVVMRVDAAQTAEAMARELR